MSKFLKLLSENAPDKSQHHCLLKDLYELLQHLGFNCEETESGIHISIPHEEDAETATNAAAVTSLMSQQDKSNLAAKAKGLVPVFQKAIDDVKKQITSPSTHI